jgi:hypothetical protein
MKPGPAQCVRKFLRYFPGGFSSEKYIAWERGYKWNAHQEWEKQLNKSEFIRLLNGKLFQEITKRAVSLESKTNLLFSFEKMALRDAVKTNESAKSFAIGLFDYIYGKKNMQQRFEDYRNMLAELPVKQTRVLTWPLLTVFGFIADPSKHIFLKPVVTKMAAKKYGYDLNYASKTGWQTYNSLLQFGGSIKVATEKLHPKDMIDIQSFIWVIGSEEYPD